MNKERKEFLKYYKENKIRFDFLVTIPLNSKHHNKSSDYYNVIKRDFNSRLKSRFKSRITI